MISFFFCIRSGDFKLCSCQLVSFCLTLRRKELPEILFCSFRLLFLALSAHLGNSGRIQCFKRKRVIEGDEWERSGVFSPSGTFQHAVDMLYKWKNTVLTFPISPSVFCGMPVIPHSHLIFSVTSIFLHTSGRNLI